MGLHYTLFRCLFDFVNNREDDDAHEVTGKKNITNPCVQQRKYSSQIFSTDDNNTQTES